MKGEWPSSLWYLSQNIVWKWDHLQKRIDLGHPKKFSQVYGGYLNGKIFGKSRLGVMSNRIKLGIFLDKNFPF